MNQPPSSVRAKRILVALDTSTRGVAALEAAVQLATSISAELQGLFVEDEDLMRLARLPFAREIDVTSALTRPLQVADMERELRSVAIKTQQLFTDALQQLNLAWNFRVVRGTFPGAPLAAAGDADMLVLGQRGRSSRTIAGDYRLRKPARKNRVVAIFDGSPSGYRAIEWGATLAQLNSTTLTVLVLSNDGATHSQQCLDWLQHHGIRAEVDQSLVRADQGILDYVRKSPPDMLLINRDSKYLGETQLCDIVNEFDCPLILC